MEQPSKIQYVKPRQDVEIHLNSGKVISGPRGSSLEEFLQVLQSEDLPPIVGAVVNGKLVELSHPVTMDAEVKPVTMGEADGMRFYRRSLTFLLETAFHEVYPDAILTIDHSVTSGGYYCQVYRRPPLTQEDLNILEERMRKFVDENLSFHRIKVPLEEGIRYFEEQGYRSKVRLMKHRKKDYIFF